MIPNIIIAFLGYIRGVYSELSISLVFLFIMFSIFISLLLILLSLIK